MRKYSLYFLTFLSLIISSCASWPEGSDGDFTVDVYPRIVYPERDSRVFLDMKVPAPFDKAVIVSGVTETELEPFMYRDAEDRLSGLVCLPAGTYTAEDSMDLEIVLFNNGRPEAIKTVSIPVRKYSPGHDMDILGPEAEQKLDIITGTSVTAGNRLKILPEAQEALTEWLSLINSAEKTLDVATCFFVDKNEGRTILDSLARKAESGVEVNLIASKYAVDAMSPGTVTRLTNSGVRLITMGLWKPPRRLSADEAPDKAVLRDGRIFGPAPDDSYYYSFEKENKRVIVEYGLHQKVLIADGRTAITGGRNIEDSYFTTWQDMDILVEGPAVTEMEQAFISQWIEFGGDRIIRQTAVNAEKGTAKARYVESRPWTGNYRTMELVCGAIDTAEKSVFITSQYLALSDRLRSSIVDAAERGLDVRIVINSLETSNPLLLGFEHYMTLGELRPLLRSGAKIYMHMPLPSDPERTYMHNKELIIDGGWAAVGSFNFSLRSCYIDSEQMLCFSDPGLLEELEAHFMKWCDTDRGVPVDLADLAEKEDKHALLMKIGKRLRAYM